MTPRPTPLVSIVLPTLNGSRYIAQSLRSCLEQTYAHLEVIVVDGGSTDGTLDVVAAAADARVRVVRQADHRGRLPGALNEGFAAARGDLYTWTQDDDWFAPDALNVLVSALQGHPEVCLAYAGFHFVDAQGSFLREAELGPPEGLYETNVVGHCFLYRRSAAEAVGAYAVDYWMAEDFQYWLRLYRHGPLLFVPGSHYFHRLHPSSLTMNSYGRYHALRVAARARRDLLGISRRAFWRQEAHAYIEEAFAGHARADLARVRRCLAAALWRNPAWLGNRGVRSLVVHSLLGRGLAQSLRRAAGRPPAATRTE